MARIRSVHPDQPLDEDFVQCSAWGRLLAIFLRNHADDNGIFEWKPVQLKMKIFPCDNVDVVALLEELAAHRQIKSFEHGGRKYGAVRNFVRYQRPKKPKAVHFMPPEFRTYVGFDGSGSEPIPHSDETDGENPPQRKEEGGSSVADATGADAPPPATDLPLCLIRAPDDDWSKPLFRQGLAYLAAVYAKPPDKLRSTIGQWLKLAGDDHRRVFDLLAKAQAQAVADPRAWITAQLGGKTNAQRSEHRNGFAEIIAEGGV